jgi:hypothetical protein
MEKAQVGFGGGVDDGRSTYACTGVSCDVGNVVRLDLSIQSLPGISAPSVPSVANIRKIFSLFLVKGSCLISYLD